MENSQQYFEQLGLREEPFAPTADPAYFYATRDHQECLFRLWNSIDSQHGIAVVLGNFGTGKTTLLRKVVSGMLADPDRYLFAVIGSPIPSWTSFALLEAIVAQFGVRPREQSFVGYMDALNQFLLDSLPRKATLLIDDAQNLHKRGQLELLRLVQNLETAQEKLLNLVFFSQLEWIEVLRAAPNFEQRINMTYTLQAVTLDEVREFISFRLGMAAVEPGQEPQFTEGAVRAVHAYTEGSPRLIVTLCRNTLLVAAQLETRSVTHELVLHTIDKTTVPNAQRRARVVAAIQEAQRLSAAPQSAVASLDAPRAERERQARERRAAELLLRGHNKPGEGEAL